METGCKKEDKSPSQALPEIKSINPASAVPGTLINIKGVHLKEVTNVRFGTIDAIFDLPADTLISAFVPDSIPAGDVFVQVYVGDGKAYSALKFTVLEGPKIPEITSVNPETALPGDDIIIAGLNFKNIGVVSFGNIVAAYKLIDSTKLIVTIPDSVKEANEVITIASITGSDTAHFLVNLAPVITSFAPALARVDDTITVHGKRFTGATSVMINTTIAAYKIINDSTITFAVSAGAVSGKISLVTNNGSATSNTNLIIH